MSVKTKKIRGFAHLFGFSANASEDEKEKSKKAKGRRAEEEENDHQDDKDKSKKSQRAEDDDADNEDDKDKSKKAKSRTAEDDDDDADADEGEEDDGDDDEDDRQSKKGRRAERDRISRILGSKYSAGKGPLAISLAITTGMSSAAAIRIMASSGPGPVASPPRRVSLDERMSQVKTHHLGEDSQPTNTSTPQGAASVMTALYNRAKGVKKS